MSPLSLFWLVAGLTLLSFGGGNTLLAGLDRELVQTGVITPGEFAAAVALGQSTPGPLAAFTTAVGRAAAGYGGAVAATLALMAVSLSAVMLIGRVPARWFRVPAVRSGLAGVGPFVVAIVPFLAWRMVQAGNLDRWPGPALILLLVTGGRLLRLPTGALMVGAVGLGMVLQGTGLAGW